MKRVTNDMIFVKNKMDEKIGPESSKKMEGTSMHLVTTVLAKWRNRTVYKTRHEVLVAPELHVWCLFIGRMKRKGNDSDCERTFSRKKLRWNWAQEIVIFSVVIRDTHVDTASPIFMCFSIDFLSLRYVYPDSLYNKENAVQVVSLKFQWSSIFPLKLRFLTTSMFSS